MKNAFLTTECWAAGEQIKAGKEEAKIGAQSV